MKPSLVIAVLVLVAAANGQQTKKQDGPTRIPPEAAKQSVCDVGSIPAKDGTPKPEETQHGSLCGCGVYSPQYPPEARKQRIQGTVILKAVIGEDGRVKDLSVVSGHPLLVPGAIEAVKSWKYKPYYVDGKAKEVETNVTVNFTLEGSEPAPKAANSNPSQGPESRTSK